MWRAVLILWVSWGGCALAPADAAGESPVGASCTYFESAWESDPGNREIQSCEQYLSWVRSFYLGSLVVPGWKRRCAEILSALSPDQARLAEPELASLGQILCSEWAKDNRVRRVSSATLVLWGRVLSTAADPDRLLAVLDVIRLDARALLKGELEPGKITLERYADGTRPAR